MQLPYPEIADQVEDARWCIDVTVARCSPPPRAGLASRVFLQDAVGSIPDAVTRAGRDGVTFGSANVGFIHSGTPREGRLAHPLLVFRPPSRSSPNSLPFSQQPCGDRTLAGGPPSPSSYGDCSMRSRPTSGVRCASFLTDSCRRRPNPKRTGSYATGYAVRNDGYLTLQHAVAALEGTEAAARSTLDRLITTNVLRRGLILNCGRCRWQAFYRTEELGPSTFPCVACGGDSGLTKETWANNAVASESTAVNASTKVARVARSSSPRSQMTTSSPSSEREQVSGVRMTSSGSGSGMTALSSAPQIGH